MAATFRWLMRLVLGLAILAGLVAALIYYLAAGSLPDYSADFSVDGAQGEIEIVRDNHSVPHIFAGSDDDVYFGLGFAHAQDRLWQMTVLRRTAQGRLSEIFGAETLAVDDFVRRLDIYNLSIEAVQFQDDTTKKALLAYSAGVNAWVRAVQEQALGRGSPEFFLFSNEFAPWQPADSIAILRLMSLKLSSHLSAEVLRARTSLLLPGNRLIDVLPDAPGPGITAFPDYASLVPDVEVQTAAVETTRHPLDPVAPIPFAGASNGWAAAPARSAAGGSLLANDPHLGFSAPSIWMLARLEFRDGGIIGATIPGVPSILTGRSDALGWGVTSSYLDDQDIYVEQLNPDNSEEYLTPDGFKPFKTRKIVIDVKDAQPVTRTLRWTDNGPVIPGARYNLASITPKGHVTSLAWTALEADDRSMTASLRIMRAKSVVEAIAAASEFTSPSQNLILADRETIGYQLIGKMPARDPDHQSQGRLPTQGWKVENRWTGTLPYADNPRIINPSGGIVANTNNKTVDRPFPYHVSYRWGDTQRIERLQRLMSNREVHTRESFIEGQLDEVSFTARSLLPLIAQDLWFSDDAAPIATPQRQRAIALALLADWNGEMNEHLPEPLIFAAWLSALQNRLLKDELGLLATEFTHPDPVFIERVFRDTKGAAIWCDVLQSSRVETCADISRAALDDALLFLSETYGSSVVAWRWGDAHQATHDHEILGKIPLLAWFVNIHQSTSGGDNTLLRGRTAGKGPNPFANVHGAGYRGVYDFADPDSSVFIIATGQSGHPLSRHYDDLAQLWRRGEYIPMSLDPVLARAAAVGISKLTPKQP